MLRILSNHNCMNKSFYLLTVLCTAFVSCTNNSVYKGILEYTEDSEFNIDKYRTMNGFNIDSCFLDEGTVFSCITSEQGISNELYTISSSDNRLLLVAGRGSESVQAGGYAFDHNASGDIKDIWYFNIENDVDSLAFTFDAPRFGKCIKDIYLEEPTFALSYNNSGELIHIDGIEAPEGDYKISAFVTESSDFWHSDLSGGDIHLVFCFQNMSSSQQNVLKDLVYVDGELGAEILHKDSRLITINLFTRDGDSTSISSMDDINDNLLKYITDYHWIRNLKF